MASFELVFIGLLNGRPWKKLVGSKVRNMGYIHSLSKAISAARRLFSQLPSPGAGDLPPQAH